MICLNYYRLILIAVSLSIDAFSLSLAYGLMNYNKRKIIIISLTVGIFHFFMPLLGFVIGNYIFENLTINPKLILLIMFLIVILEMIKGLNEEVEKKVLNIIGTFIFALLVSVDSFSVGIGISYEISKMYFASLVFSVTSFIFTLGGFFLGKYISGKIEKASKIVGICIMFTLLIYYLCK